MKTKTLKKHKIRRSRTSKRNIGGDTTIDKLAMITFIRNIAVQILNSIEDPKPDFATNTKYDTIGISRRIYYSPIITSMNKNNIKKINFDDFKKKASDMVNERNAMIHPTAELMMDSARTSIKLSEFYSLQETLSFELGILKFFTRDRPKTRSTTEIIDPDIPDGFILPKRKGSNIGKDTIGKDTIGKDTIGKDTIGKDTIGKDTIGKDIAYTSKK